MMIVRWYSGEWWLGKHIQSTEGRCGEVETMMFTLMPREDITQAADGDAVMTNAQKQQADYAEV